MSDNNGNGEVCCVCGLSGHTAHDLAWSEADNGWVCDDCTEDRAAAELHVNQVNAHRSRGSYGQS